MPDVLRVTGLAETITRLQAAPSRIPQTLASIMRTRLGEAVQYARATYLTGGTTSTRLASRTGALAASFDFTTSMQGNTVHGQLGYLRNPPPWISVHEGWPDGRSRTTIRPRRAQYLAIPLTDAARRVGSPRNFSDDLFAARSRRGNLLLFRRVGAGIEPVYLLRSEVTIPSRPALVPTAHRVIPQLREDFGAAIRLLITRG